MRIPLSAPDITEPEIEAVAAVLRTPHLSLGPRLAEFEAAFTALTGVPHAIAVSSGTAGLHLAVKALNIGESDEVLVPSFTFIAAANAIRYERATPVFVDIDPDSLNLAPSAVEAAITPRTRALLIVHTFGRPADMDPLLAIAKRHKLAIIEDACEAIGATYRGRPIGSFGDIAVFAFYPNKQITTGEGGMIVTRDPSLAAAMRSLRNQGRGPSDDWLQHTDLGYNYRLSDIASTLGLGQLRRLPEILARRADVARLYHHHLSSAQHLILPPLEIPDIPETPASTISWFVFAARLAPQFSTADRDALLGQLHRSGIACARYFAPIHLQPAYAAYRDARLPVTESVAARTLALPFFNRLTEPEIAEVAATLRTALALLRP
ncbi:MAG TPA: DegT/DnrJ/EryC1/StrS family aminotransferase [Granulicella sp.]|nr:DegT/DnrJ/EryC1/StrS family aminotransferase [Granulicella sp.]